MTEIRREQITKFILGKLIGQMIAKGVGTFAFRFGFEKERTTKDLWGRSHNQSSITDM